MDRLRVRSYAEQVGRSLPIAGWLPSYRRQWLRPDVAAGVVVVGLLVPEGIAYAQIAGMPPETVFSVAPAALLLYALFASSRKLIVVVSAPQAVLSASAVGAVAASGTAEFMALTSLLALLVGLVSIAAGLLGLGKVSQFFSPSVLTGFVSGLALVIAIRQVPKILQIESGRGNFFQRSWDILVGIDQTHRAALAIGVISVVTMVLAEHFLRYIPSALAALVAGITLSRIFDLDGRGVHVITKVPSGLAGPALPHAGLTDLGVLLPAAVAIFLVSFAEANSVARVFASRDGSKIDPNAQLLGLGTANVAAGVFQGFTIGASMSKSAAADRAGMRTQVAALVAAGLTVVVALFLTGWFRDLPEPTLGAIVIVVVSRMINRKEFRRLYALRRTDFVLAVVALLGVLTLNVLSALVFAVVLSIVLPFYRAAAAGVRVLGQTPEGGRFRDVEQHSEARQITGVLVIRPAAELRFSNAESLEQEVLGRVSRESSVTTAVVLDLEATNDLDVPAADALLRLTRRLSALGIALALTHLHAPVRRMVDRAGVTAELGEDRLFASNEEAVSAVRHPQG